jgi:hypothetical protein
MALVGYDRKKSTSTVCYGTNIREVNPLLNFKRSSFFWSIRSFLKLKHFALSGFLLILTFLICGILWSLLDSSKYSHVVRYFYQHFRSNNIDNNLSSITKTISVKRGLAIIGITNTRLKWTNNSIISGCYKA